MSPSNRRRALTTLVLGLVVTLTMSTQAYAADALVYNPLQMVNSWTTTYTDHPVHFFSGWTNRFAQDINGPSEVANGPVYLAGSGWTTAIVKTAPDNPFGWQSYKWIGPTCTPVGMEYTMGVTLALPNGNQTTGFAVGHLSDYFYGPGDSIAQGAQVGTLSFLSNSGSLYSAPSCAESSLTSTGPHIHVESARTGTTFNNALDPISGPYWQPYWYYQYP